MEVDVVAYLQSKGVQVKNATAGNIHIACPHCGEDPAKRGRCYISTTSDPPALYTCFLCGRSGAINSLRKVFGDPPLNDDEIQTQSLRTLKVWEVAANYYHDALDEHIGALRWWTEERGLSIETVTKHKLGYAAPGLSDHLKSRGFTQEEVESTSLVVGRREFLQGTMTIPYVTSGHVTLIRGRALSGGSQKYLTPPGQKGKLFNSDATFTAENELIVTEGEIDCMVLEQHGFPAVGVSGAQGWQDSWASYFSEVRRVFVVFDNDDPGRRGAQKVVNSIGPKARIVTMPEEVGKKNDPSEWFACGHTPEEFRLLLKDRSDSILLTVHQAYEEWKGMQGVDGLKFGIEALDFRLSPGCLPGQLLVYLAKTGVGKTLLLLNLFQRMSMQKPDIKILFVSLEQTRSEWFERARRIYRFYNPDERDERTLEYFDKRMMIVDRNRLSEQALVDVIHEYADDVGHNPDLLAVDYLGYWARSYKGEAYERTSAAVMALKAITKDERIFTIAPHQVNRMTKKGEEVDADSARESGVVEETADFLLTLWSEDHRRNMKEDAKTGQVTVKIAKSRHGGTDAVFNLQFAPLSLAMVPLTEYQLAARAKAEMHWLQCRDTYEVAVYRHATGDERLVVPSQDFADWQATLI